MATQRVGLVSCTCRKVDGPAPSRELYAASSNFRKWVAWVEQSCDRWFVLSAKHHLVDPDEVLAWYDRTLDDASVREKRRWSHQVVSELEAVLGDVGQHSFEIHAGRNYWAFGLREKLEARGASVMVPAERLNLFERATFYSQQAATANKEAGHGRRAVGSYEALREYLARRDVRRVELSFEAFEEILGRMLPPSAHNHRAWWGNHVGAHSHARSWLEAGWEVEEVNLAGARVVFRKVG